MSLVVRRRSWPFDLTSATSSRPMQVERIEPSKSPSPTLVMVTGRNLDIACRQNAPRSLGRTPSVVMTLVTISPT
jgi:hypothetical protein